MASLLALAGLNLDRAYPELGVDAAKRRRSAATTLLLGAIGQAQRTGADALVFVGELFDERCVSPQSVTSLVQILDAYPGQVLIAPGGDSEGIYASTNWGPRTFVWSSNDFAAAPEPFGVVQGRGGQRGRSAALPVVSSGGGVSIIVDPELALESTVSWTNGCRGRHSIICGSADDALDGVTVLAPANPDLGEQWGRAALLSYDSVGVTNVERVTLTEQGSAETVDVDVSAFGATEDLLAALDRTIAVAPEWSVIRLVGELPQGVQLPITAGYAPPRDDVAIRTDEISFGFTQADQNDHTALAEFVRSLSDADADERDRHQAIALGIAALVPSNGAGES
ncbi:hypothetical protein [Mycolicibacterium fortuitum]|uniref:hypothetical protein n=1 Tax=Mycolicibacterium fortuitum TaxID=1766 RepID=UPI00104255C2|nr:hypothetical protein [Mycolicibacterium fortuitum]